ncbi:MAG: hypothetical protein SGPRY_002313, partial [Prymnesium sp.]
VAALALVFNFASALCTIVANKYALKVFPFPAALTAIHYVLSWAAVQLALRLGIFVRGTVPHDQRKLFYSLVVAWATCNALSNASLEANSVGFYQLMKVLTTPIVVFIDFVWHGKVISCGKAAVLALACLGIAVATVSDVQLTLRGSLIALASVMFGVAQKTLNEHMQQRGGLSTLQLMLEAFPPMTAIGILLVPLMDPPGLITSRYTWPVITKVSRSCSCAPHIDASLKCSRTLLWHRRCSKLSRVASSAGRVLGGDCNLHQFLYDLGSRRDKRFVTSFARPSQNLLHHDHWVDSVRRPAESQGFLWRDDSGAWHRLVHCAQSTRKACAIVETTCRGDVSSSRRRGGFGAQ